MPNWCSNTLTLTHEDPAQIQRAANAFKQGCFLQELVPNPSGDWNYDWSVAHWGTKWDVGGGDYPVPEIDEDGQTVYLNFDSAWAPPIEAYAKMQEQGFGVRAMYYEPGCAFCGIWDAGCDEYYELSGMSADQVESDIPAEINEYFGISDGMREWEEPEPLTEWYVDGAREKGLIE